MVVLPYLYCTVLFCLFFYDKRKIRRLKTPSYSKEIGYFRAGFNSIQLDAPLNAEALTTLCATSSEYSTATLGGHTSTETVALRTLAIVRLISAFHINFPFIFKE